MKLHTRYPITNLISEGNYSLMIDNAGSGYSAINGNITLTRWKEDPVNCQYGTFIFINDLTNNKSWSATYQPTRVEPEYYEVNYFNNKIEYIRDDFGFRVATEITLVENENLEIRKITIQNNNKNKIKLAITSYAEVALMHQKADSAHPAFAKMFIESEWQNDCEALIFARRPRSIHEEKLYLAHTTNKKVLKYESSRMEFLGRGNTISKPDMRLVNKVGSILDPIFALQCQIELEANSSDVIYFVTAFSKNKNELINKLKNYKLENKLKLEFTKANILRNNEAQLLANSIFYNISQLRSSEIPNNRLTQSALWRFGVSGDLPIIAVNKDSEINAKLIEQCLNAHSNLRHAGLEFDLIILGEYLEHPLANKRGGVFCLNDLSAEEKILIQTLARASLMTSKGELIEQLNFINIESNKPQIKSNNLNQKKPSIITPDLEFKNSYGGFIDDGKSYLISNTTPQPWSNIVANPNFGFIVTESGGGYTWSENSRENRLTPWQNDPVSDSQGEVLYIKDGDNLWSPTPKPFGQKCITKHCLGYSEFISSNQEIDSHLTLSGSINEPVKWWNLKLKNNSSKAKSLEITLYLEWVLGVLREDNNRHLLNSYDSESSILYAVNNYNGEFAGRYVYLGSDSKIKSYTTDRIEFLGRYSDISSPQSIINNLELSNKTGCGYDSCAVLKVELNIEANQEQEVSFFISEAKNLNEAKINTNKFSKKDFRLAELNKVKDFWKSTLETVQIKTPDRSFDLMINTWILYQTLACRLYARSAYYQSGGAIGYRDQLQDVMALLYSKPELARTQIILHASRQFIEGDVQHWWHPPGGKGVRTRISDDYLWLPYVVHRYLEVTEDYSVLNEVASYLDGSKLREGQMEDYMMPFTSDKQGTIYEHCVLALNRALKFGKNGFPLMGGGDWNDGMNEVGKDGEGESVWLAWFLSDCLSKFSFVSSRLGDEENSKIFKEKAKELIDSIDKNAWDGEWYLRAFYDDGTPMGSKSSDECKIDSLSQSWSVIVGKGDKQRSSVAMESIRKKLVKKNEKIICLLDPAFHDTIKEPGYIKGYLAGIRENGGQYTHAAAWVIMATALEGKGKEATELFSMINPINHTLDAESCMRYKTEPYVYCGDVYSNSQLPGHGGWSWYTGSAAWLYQVGIEHIIGLKIRGQYLRIDPCINPEWKEFSIKLKYNNQIITIEIKNPHGVEKGVKSIKVNGKISSEMQIKLENTKSIQVEMG